MRALGLRILVGLSWVSVCSLASAQNYEQRYGRPIDVTLGDLTFNPESYDERAVRTKGRLDMLGSGDGRTYGISESGGPSVIVYPMRELQGVFEQDALEMTGQMIEITGLFRATAGGGDQFGSSQPRGTIFFWALLGPPEKKDPDQLARAPLVTLEKLLTSPGQRDGQTVRVIGKFRGKNLYGDLPARSRRRADDWVIKHDVFAVWVTERKPKGNGFELDPELKRDTGKWLEVVGRVETRRGVTFLFADAVMLTKPPSQDAVAAAPAPPPRRPARAPVVIFALPLDGEVVAPDSQFVVQFSNDMDETSFEGRVVLRYTGLRLPGDHPLDGVSFDYDGGLRALTVDPGDLLYAGREIELLLLAGIADLEGLELEARPGRDSDELAADVFVFSIGSPLG